MSTKLPHYKLSYFDIRGLAECARMQFALADVKYEDNRIARDKWPEIKKTTPFGHVPLLEFDGVVIAESSAINRYLARQFGFAGKTEIEQALVDSIADAGVDYDNACEPHFDIAAGFVEGDKEAKYREVVLPARERFFPAIEAFLKKSASGFLVGNSVTWADLVISASLATQHAFAPELYDGYPEVQKFVTRIEQLPKIREWIARRPKSRY